MQYRDVVIHTNSGIFGKGKLRKEFPPVQQRIDLCDHIWLGRPDVEMATTIMDTCEPKVFGVSPSPRQFTQLYSFVRELPASSHIHRWDEDNELTSVVVLSRLVYPTSTALVYAARLGYDGDALKQISPAKISGVSREAFLSPNRTRDWLTDADATVLREIVPTRFQELPRPIHTALWHHESALRTYYLDHRWTLVCTGLEALVHTDKHPSTGQFIRRVPRLALELGITISEQEAEEAYDLRCQLAGRTRA